MRNKNTNQLKHWMLLQKKKSKHVDGDQTLQKIWDNSESYGQDFEPDVEAGLAQLKNRISNQPQVAKTVNMRQRLRAIAAILVIGLAVIGTYRHFTSIDTDAAVAWIEVETLMDDKREVILPDGSEVTLNKNSHLFYASNINTADQRLVRLEGEAFFNVNRRPSQAFIISTDNSEVEVLGTSFNVRAYSNESQTEVEVSTGRVAFRDISNQKESILHANEVAILNNNHQMIEMVTPALNRTAWKTNILSFKDTDLQTAIPLIGRYYDIELTGLKELKGGCAITGNWENEPLEDVFRWIEGLTGLSIEQVSDKSYHLKGSCK